MGSNFRRILRDGDARRRHAVDVAYGVGSLAYSAAMAAVVIILYRITLQGWINSVLPAVVATILAWFLAVGLSSIFVMGVVGDMRPRAPAAG
jgi:hypothetical protein